MNRPYPIRLPPDGEPEPDFAAVRDRAYGSALPVPDDVLLVIEGADSSRDYDRRVKLPLYAAAGIPEAWLVDLVAETVERYTQPHKGRYQQLTLAGRGQSLASTVLPAVILPVDDVLG